MATQTVSVFWFWRHLGEIKHLSWLNWETIGLAGLVGAYAPIKAVIAPEYVPTLAQLQHLDWRVVASAFVAGAVLALVHQIIPTPKQTETLENAQKDKAIAQIKTVEAEGRAQIFEAAARRSGQTINLDDAARLHAIMGDKK